MNVNRKMLNKAVAVIVFVASVVMAWGGMIYALGKTEIFHPVGLVIALTGYFIVPWAIHLYEISANNETDSAREKNV